MSLIREAPYVSAGSLHLIQRRDGTIPQWPAFVLGGRDPSAPKALRAYAADARERGQPEQYVNDVLRLAAEFEEYLRTHGAGDPGAPPHRKDDPEIVEKILQGKSA